MRLSMRRLTRLTNAFSKKIQNHTVMVAIHAVHYNFPRIHKTLRKAREAGEWFHRMSELGTGGNFQQ